MHRLSTRHPSRHARRPKATHILETSTAHGEIADEVPDQSDELADGGDDCQDERLELDAGLA